MRTSATSSVLPKPVAIKQGMRFTFIPLFLILLLAWIVSWGASLSSKEFAQQIPIAWVPLASAAGVALITWTFYQWRGRQRMARLDSQFNERLSERARIARDLHDTLLQGLLSAHMQLCAAGDQLPEDSASKRLIRRVLDIMAQTIDDGRDAIRGLRSSNLGSRDLEQAFLRIHQELITQREAGQFAFRFLVVGTPRPLHPAAHDEVYLIGREALINAVRHSNARKIEVELEYATKSLRILIRDDGCGIDPKVLRSGREGHWGLPGMLERAKRIKAKLRVLSSVGEGTEIELAVPSSVAFDPQAIAKPSKEAHPRKW